jgi:hypothetical protein
MASDGIFLTYNDGSSIGKNTALRIQTNAQLYGTKVDLPSRYFGGAVISDETTHRIKQSSVLVAFSLEILTPALQSELRYAMTINKPILVLYDQGVKNIDFGNYKRIKEVELDYLNTDDTLKKVSDFLDDQRKGRSKVTDKEIGLETAILGIGLGLLALWALNSSK